MSQLDARVQGSGKAFSMSSMQVIAWEVSELEVCVCLCVCACVWVFGWGGGVKRCMFLSIGDFQDGALPFIIWYRMGCSSILDLKHLKHH